MELTPDAIEAGRLAYQTAEANGEDPVRAAVRAAVAEILKPVTVDRYRKWSRLEAMVVFAEDVRPKTYTLYDDAMRRTVGRASVHNLFLMMSMLVSQTLHDLYTTSVNMGFQSQYPTERDFFDWYFSAMQKEYGDADRRQTIIDDLKSQGG